RLGRRVDTRHGAGRRGGGSAAHVRYSQSGLVDTVAPTSRPERSRPVASASLSSTIFTGTRCTILVKLPVAVSCGTRLNVAPVFGAMLSTWPFTLRCG